MTQLLVLLIPRPETKEKESIRVRAGKKVGMSSAVRAKSSAKARTPRVGCSAGTGIEEGERGAPPRPSPSAAPREETEAKQEAGKVDHSQGGVGSVEKDPEPCQ